MLVIVFSAILLLIFIQYPLAGLYAMAFLFPFSNWQFQLQSINVPYVDLVALFLFSAVCIRFVIHFHEKKKFDRRDFLKIFPGIFFAGMFFIACSLSIFNNEFFSEAFKYLLRPLIFFYLMFVVLPVNLLHDKKSLNRILKIFLAVGVAVAIMGFLSLLFASGSWYMHRATPFSFGDFNPLGGNHNAVAEVLIVALPCAMILFLQAGKVKFKGWYVLAMLFMSLILILTFSRSGWLGLLLELLILFFVRYVRQASIYLVSAVVMFLILIPAIFYITVWNQVGWIQVSNSNRLLMTEISLNKFAEHPIIGHGLNTFQKLVGETFVYQIEFGEALDSHGFAQKLLTETGLLGFLTFLAFLFYIFHQYYLAYTASHDAHSRMIILCFIMMLSGITLMELFSTSYFIATMWLPVGVGLAGVRVFKS